MSMNTARFEYVLSSSLLEPTLRDADHVARQSLCVGRGIGWCGVGSDEYSAGAATALDAPLAPVDEEGPSGPDDVVVGDDHDDPDVRMAGWGNSPLPLTPNDDSPIPPAPGAQPQIGPFPVPPEVAAAAGPALSTVHPHSRVDKMLLPDQGSPVRGGTPLDPLFEQLLAPAPAGPLTPRSRRSSLMRCSGR
jgi:hypothetical protein